MPRGPKLECEERPSVDGRGHRGFGGVDAGRVQRGGDILCDRKGHREVGVVDDEVDAATSGPKPDGVAVFGCDDREGGNWTTFKRIGDGVSQGDRLFAGEDCGVDEGIIEQDSIPDLREGRLDDEGRRGGIPCRLLLINLQLLPEQSVEQQALGFAAHTRQEVEHPIAGVVDPHMAGFRGGGGRQGL